MKILLLLHPMQASGNSFRLKINTFVIIKNPQTTYKHDKKQTY